MAALTRSKPARDASPAGTAALEARVAELEADRALAFRILARLIVHAATGQHAATFRQVAVDQARVASHAEAERIEHILSEHHGG